MVHIPRWQIIMIIAVLVLGAAFAAPNLIKRETAEGLPDWIPSEQVNLGLDLQGGAHLLIEVGIETVFKEQRENLIGALRVRFRNERIGYLNLGTDGPAVVFKVRDLNDVEKVRAIVRDTEIDISTSVSDDGEFRIEYTEASLRNRRDNVLAQTIEVIRRRVDELGTREPSIQRHGDERVIVQLPGERDPERAKEIIGRTAKMNFRFVDENATPGVGRLPAGTELLASGEEGETRQYVVKKRIIVSGESLTDAQATFQDGQPVVSFTFDPVGAKKFADATQKNVGRVFAIILDGKVISAPVIRSPILGGRGIISGSFSVQAVQDLALLLRAGALPAPLTYLEERSVGPGLGADSIQAGKIAGVLGLVFVLIFIVATYGLFGVMVNVALALNLVLLLGALSGLQATLTLPGIAGIVLTIGMAVDANVLIFERIREEVANGRGPVTAIDAGYRRALGTIIDSNLTTLIAAILLFQFGSGPVKGFAVTLAIGLITSMFTAIMVTRLMVTTWLQKRRPQSLPIGGGTA